MRPNPSALTSIVATTLRMNLRRFTVWVFAGVFLWVVWLLYWGDLGFSGMTASGAKLATNSEFAIATTLGFFSFFLMHFTATLTGDPVVVDVRLGTAPLLRAQPIDRATYLLGKFLGGYLSLLSIYLVFLAALILGQFLPPAADKLTLPVRLAPYLEFAFLFMLAPTFFVGAVSFSIGSLTGSMKLVYITVTVLFVAWLLLMRLVPDEYYRWLAWFEPSGTLWLDEYVAKSRGNTWLNEHPIRFDLPFLLNRLALFGAGTSCLAITLVAFRGAELDVEYGGEVRESLGARLARWVRGRPRALEDRYTNWLGVGNVPRVEPAPRGPLLWTHQLVGSTATELRLLAAERSLWIMLPVVVVLAVFTTGTAAGPFRVPLYPVSSEFAARMSAPLLVLIAGTSIFYTGEIFHRDESSGVRSIVYATPIANSALLLSKLLASIALSLGMVALTYATAIVTQLVLWSRLDGRSYSDLGPYAELGLRQMLPAVVVISGVSLAVNVLARGRYLAYFALIGLGVSYLWGLFGDRPSLLTNPLLIGHLRYSDVTGLEPYARGLLLHHVYWGAVVCVLFSLATWFFARSGGPGRGLASFLGAPYLRRRTGLVACALGSVAVALWSGARIHAEANPRGTRLDRERAMLRLEDAYRAELFRPEASYSAVDIEVDLWPGRAAVDVRGRLTLVNDHPAPLERLRFTVDPLYTIRRLDVARTGRPQASPEYVLDDAVLTLPLGTPLDPGESCELLLDWGGPVGPELAVAGGPRASFVQPSGSFLSSLRPELIPVPGVSPDLFLRDADRRREHGRERLEVLADLSGADWVPALFGSSRPFDFRARITAPADQVALACGELIERGPAPGARGVGRTAHTWITREPIRGFAVLAGRYDVRRSGPHEVWYHPEHTYNLDTVLAALDQGRAFFERSFGPFPHRSLRIVEFPRLATFAQTYPTLMPYSEAIGFLTNYREGDRFMDATWFVTAHEVAHQWWGYALAPGASCGAQVLSESLAEYSALALLEETRGERAALVALRREEASYLRRRDADLERPLAELGLDPGEQPLWYNKGGLVLHMLEEQLGRERLLGALRAFVEQHGLRDGQLDLPARSGRRRAALSHPTVEDLLATLHDAARRGPAGRPTDLGWFFETWMRSVAVPDMTFASEPERVREAGGWSVHFEIRHETPIGVQAAPAPLPVEVQLVAGDWRPERSDSMQPGTWRAAPPMRLWLAPGQTARGTLSAAFEPEAIVIDRRLGCLDFDRSNNVREFEPTGSDASGGATGTRPAAR